MENSQYYYDITGTIQEGDNKTIPFLVTNTTALFPLGTPLEIITEAYGWKEAKHSSQATISPLPEKYGSNYATVKLI